MVTVVIEQVVDRSLAIFAQTAGAWEKPLSNGFSRRVAALGGGGDAAAAIVAAASKPRCCCPTMPSKRSLAQQRVDLLTQEEPWKERIRKTKADPLTLGMQLRIDAKKSSICRTAPF